MELSIGDVVILNSGGPSMTVDMILDKNSEGPLSVLYKQLKMSGFTDNTAISCKWFDEPTNSFKQDFFKLEMLRKKG